MRNGRPNPAESRKGGDGDITVGQKPPGPPPAARKETSENAFHAGTGIAGTEGVRVGEQHTQRSSGKSTARKPAVDGPCRPNAATDSAPHEFIGAVGSHRS